LDDRDPPRAGADEVCRCQAASQRLAGHAGDGRRPVEGEGRASGGRQVNA
jgi:hypothetical protein